MSSYLSSILTTTTSRYASLRSLISTSEDDGPTPDDTHLCRVLRSYYTEKSRSFPAWLPPDPKGPAPVQPVYTQPVGAGYGNVAGTGVGGAQVGGGSKLGSLWGGDNANTGSNAPGNGSTGSLRLGRGVRSQTEAPQARPLPSQRAGTYQSGPAAQTQAQSGGGSAQDRLKARLMGGGRAASPVGQAQGQPQGQMQDVKGGYDASYEDSFAAEPPQRLGGGLPSGGPRSGLPRGPRPMR